MYVDRMGDEWEVVGKGGKHKGQKDVDVDKEIKHMAYGAAMEVLKDEYTIHKGMNTKKYREFKRLRDVKKEDDIDLRAPGQGQMKLIISEVRFLEENYDVVKRVQFSGQGGTFMFKARKDERTYSSVVMYVGASDGKHIAQFTQMYPNTLFVLVDKRDPHYGLREESFQNLFFVHDYWYGGEEVDRFFQGEVPSHDKERKKTYVKGGPGPAIKGSKCPVLFISDLRSVDTTKMNTKKGDEAVEKDHRTQEDVLERIRGQIPGQVRAYMLKFRPPYLYTKGYNGKRTKGDLWVQSYARGSSNELRIVHKFKDPTQEALSREGYNIEWIDNVMAYINTVKRVKGSFDARGASCVTALIRHNRGGNPNHQDVLRFKHTIVEANIPLEDKRVIKFSGDASGGGTVAYNLDVSSFFM